MYQRRRKEHRYSKRGWKFFQYPQPPVIERVKAVWRVLSKRKIVRILSVEEFYVPSVAKYRQNILGQKKDMYIIIGAIA